MRNDKQRGVSRCPRCGDKSQIEHTFNDTSYVRRLRGCIACGNTWSTAEVALPVLKRNMKIEKLVRSVTT
jgi:transcriptional regulator NrdR family protein